MNVSNHLKYVASFVLAYVGFISPASAQIPDRYPKLDDFGHQIYLEQHELPVLAHGPTDPAPAPNGKTLAIAAQGWIWLLDLETMVATRITDSPAVDSRPRWSADGLKLAIVRDFGADTGIVILDVKTGAEQIINTASIDLDPEFSADGQYVYYANGVTGSMNIWQHHLASGAEQKVTDLPQVERNVRRVPNGNQILYLHGDGPHRSLRLRDFISGQDKIIHAETLTYHLSADVHKTLPLIAYSAPIDGDYHLWTMDINDPRVRHRLTDGDHYALTPAFSADGDNIYFVEADENRQFELKRIKTYGGSVQTIDIRAWDYGAETGEAVLRISDSQGGPVTARISARRQDGHPVASHMDATYLDPKSGRTYFYVEGEAEMTLPVGLYQVEVSRGFFEPNQVADLVINGSAAAELNIQLNSIWDARQAGYISADYHNHINGDGTSRARHSDALRLLAGEDLDHVGGMTWNRWERRIDRDILGKRSKNSGRFVDQGQEVRSHFHGHIGLTNIVDPYEPWFWGPGNPVLGNPDLANADVLAYAKEIGAFPTFVHPAVPEEEPFVEPRGSNFSVDYINELILEDGVGMEIVTGWHSPLGNMQLWYRLLNIGQNVIGMSGTDAWADFYRTPAFGTARNFVPFEEGKDDFTSVLASTTAGRGFVSTGPALLFKAGENLQPGDVIQKGPQSWSLTVASVVGVDTVEIIVNGQVKTVLEGVEAGERKVLSGTLDLPEGGWVAARAYSSDWLEESWPLMHKKPFAHTQPIWIGQTGSIDTDAFNAAAADLIQILDVTEQKARNAYGQRPMPKLYSRYERARQRLTRGP